LPPQPSGKEPIPQQSAGESHKKTEPAPAPSSPQATKPAPKAKRAERTPSPHEVEKSTIGAIDRDAPMMPTGSQVVSRGESFKTIVDRLTTLREAAPNSPNLRSIDSMRREVLNENVWQLMQRQANAGRPELRDSYLRLYNLAQKRANRGDTKLKDELDNFTKSGLVGARKPDSVVLIDEGGGTINFVLTDPTVKSEPAALMVHDFKSLFYREGMHALMGNSPKVKVESWEHNPGLGIHREARAAKKLPPY
jgi:hypothetical protein